MPTYNYKCTNCKYQFSVFQKMSDDPIIVCSKCEGKVKRIISGGSGIIFKGTGFYLTDYGKSGTSKKSESTPTESTKKEGSKNE
jgi:putative FmdB family regulatory protein